MVMGNRNQLQWDLPALDSYELIRAIYRLPAADFRRTRDELIELLDLGDLVHKPVRNLSLGERMKVEIAGALLHRPQVLFLDEPTIGLDVTMQKRIRAFVAEYNQRYGATVLLTSHYMADVQALCKRVIVIHHGRILFDGDLAALADAVRADQDDRRDPAGAARSTSRRTARSSAATDGKRDRCASRAPTWPDVTTRLLRDLPVRDLTIEDPPIEDVIELVFADGDASAVGRRAGERRRDPSDWRRAPGLIGRVRGLVDIYVTEMRIAIAEQFQYRVANYFYMIGMVAEPVIYLVVWSTVARRSRAARSAAITPGEFAAYYIVWTLVRNMNIVFTPYGWEERIREGAAVRACSCARSHPIHLRPRLLRRLEVRRDRAVAADRGGPGAHLPSRRCTLAPLGVVVFCVAIWGAYLIRSLNYWALGLITLLDDPGRRRSSSSTSPPSCCCRAAWCRCR